MPQFQFVVAKEWRTQAPATEGKPVHNVDLTETHDIADAAAVSATIDVLLKDAASCPSATSKDRQACGCGFTDDLKSSLPQLVERSFCNPQSPGSEAPTRCMRATASMNV